jgi:hypothetical protein
LKDEQMSRQEEIIEILSAILQTALLRIRAAGWTGDGAGCALEADHVHNIPTIIATGSESLLQTYWEVERPLFAARGSHLNGFQPLWDRLEALLEEHAAAP